MAAGEIRRHPIAERRPQAAGVVATEGLELDHVGAEVGQGHAAPRSGQHTREVANRDAVQGGCPGTRVSAVGAEAQAKSTEGGRVGKDVFRTWGTSRAPDTSK